MRRLSVLGYETHACTFSSCIYTDSMYDYPICIRPRPSTHLHACMHRQATLTVTKGGVGAVGYVHLLRSVGTMHAGLSYHNEGMLDAYSRCRCFLGPV
jgi:hypothetical protein